MAKPPRPYAIEVDCAELGREAAYGIMTMVFRWSERYSISVLDGMDGELVVSHSFSSIEIAETKLLQACGLLAEAGRPANGVSMRVAG